MHIAFRVDATHGASSRLRRSLALAAGLLESDPSCKLTFLLSGTESACVAVQQAGYACRYLGRSALPSWNLEATESAVDGLAADVLVVDDHNIDERFLSELDGKTFIALMDDGMPLKSCRAGAIVNPNINAHTYQYATGDSALLLGTEFVALSGEFDTYQEFRRENPERARRILVDFSGPDSEGATLSVVRLLKTIPERFLVEVSVSACFVHGEALAREIGLDDRFMVVSGEAGRARRMASADMTICSSDMTFYECLLFGLPCALVLATDGCATLAEYAGGNGFAIYLGEPSGLDERAAKLLQGMISDKAARDRMSARTTDLVDGLGRFRLADELLALCKGI